MVWHLPILKYSDVIEAIEQANDSEYGLGGSVGPDAKQLIAISLNRQQFDQQHLVRKDEVAPFGDVKSSGLGSEVEVVPQKPKRIYRC